MNLKSGLIFSMAALILSGCGGGSDTPTPPPPAALRASIDAYLKDAMTSMGASAVTISIMQNDKVLYEQGYGFSDAKKTIPFPANGLFRTGSIIKPVTAAAIRQLAGTGRLALSDHVFCTGANAPCWLPPTLLPTGHDARTKDITLGQLIAHQGGWNQDVSGNPLELESAIMDALELARPPTREEVIRSIMARPLDFTPGSAGSYSNFGYVLLGEVIELATKTAYRDHAYRTIMAPLGVGGNDFITGQTKAQDRDPREAAYISEMMGPSIFTPGTMALAMNEGALLEHWIACGGIVTTAHAMAAFGAQYRLPDGAPLAGKTNIGAHYGGLPGVSTIVRQLDTGVSYAVFLNISIPEPQFDKVASDIDALIRSKVK